MDALNEGTWILATRTTKYPQTLELTHGSTFVTALSHLQRNMAEYADLGLTVSLDSMTSFRIDYSNGERRSIFLVKVSDRTPAN